MNAECYTRMMRCRRGIKSEISRLERDLQKMRYLHHKDKNQFSDKAFADKNREISALERLISRYQNDIAVIDSNNDRSIVTDVRELSIETNGHMGDWVAD